MQAQAPIRRSTLIGDFNTDGNFYATSPGYFADGPPSMPGNLDRKAAFTQVDVCASAATSSPPPRPTGAYHNGDSRGDVAGAAGTTPGFAPRQPTAINAADIDYVYKQFKQNTATGGGPVHWAVLSEAGTADLTADINGDLVIDQNDVNELVQTILGTSMGDVNLDGVCDATDLAVAQAHLGQSGGWAMGDVDGDGIVTAADIAIIQGCIGPHCGSRGLQLRRRRRHRLGQPSPGRNRPAAMHQQRRLQRRRRRGHRTGYRGLLPRPPGGTASHPPLAPPQLCPHERRPYPTTPGVRRTRGVDGV